MTLRPREVDKMWRKLQFEIVDEGHHVYATFKYADKFILRTKRSHGRRGLDGNVPQFIRKQMKLSSRQFSDAVDCPLDYDGYLEILREGGHLSEVR